MLITLALLTLATNLTSAPTAPAPPCGVNLTDLGTPGNDRIIQHGRCGNNTLSISGADGNDWLAHYGGPGNDILNVNAGFGDDYIYQNGGAGNDQMTADGGDGNDWIVQEGGPGDDVMTIGAGLGNDHIVQRGGAGNDSLTVDAGEGNDTVQIYGGEGNDTIVYDISGGLDIVFIDGGPGYDTLTVNLRNYNLTIKNEVGTILCQFGTGGTTMTIKDIEQLTILDSSGNPLACPGFSTPIIAPAKRDRYSTLSSLPAGYEPFGSSVAISGNIVVVGAPDKDAVYVFIKPGIFWANQTPVATLTGSDTVLGDHFGASVAIDGDTIVIGAPLAKVGSNEVQGAAFIFTKPVTGWAGNLTQTTKLTASDGTAGDEFGTAVGVSGTTITVGARFAAVAGKYGQGAAYVFTNGTQTAKLTASDGAAVDAFGSAVAISSSTIIVGAPWADIGGNLDQGAAYVFVSTVQAAKLTASDATIDQFGAELGIAVAVSGDTVVAGAYHADVGTNLNQGAAYVFVKPGGGWANMTQTGKLTTSDAGVDEFGIAVGIDGTTVVIGSPLGNSSKGAGYVFVMPGGGWANKTQDARLTSSDVDVGSLGASAAINGDTIALGAPAGHYGRGGGYIFTKPGGGWSGNLNQTARLIAGAYLFLPLILR